MSFFVIRSQFVHDVFWLICRRQMFEIELAFIVLENVVMLVVDN